MDPTSIILPSSLQTAAVLTIVLAFAGYLMTFLSTRMMARRADRLRLVNQRLNEFYGPLYVATVAGNIAYRSLLRKQGREQGALRVAVIGGGCSGLQYKMDLVDGPANRDIMVESQNVRVVVDPKSALFVSGSVLDFSEDLQKGGFKVTNPNAVAHCSCGESFAA